MTNRLQKDCDHDNNGQPMITTAMEPMNVSFATAEGHWDLPGAPPEPGGHAPPEGDTCCLAMRAARCGTSLLFVIGAL